MPEGKLGAVDAALRQKDRKDSTVRWDIGITKENDMLALELNKDTVKIFMGRILREEIFDAFEVRNIDISTAAHIAIDGGIKDETDQRAKFNTWETLRPLVYTIIKSSSKPRHMKIVFSCKPEQALEIHHNAAALFLNMLYENDGITFTTATSQREFAMDKSLDSAWDEWVTGFFSRTGVKVSERE